MQRLRQQFFLLILWQFAHAILVQDKLLLVEVFLGVLPHNLEVSLEQILLVLQVHLCVDRILRAKLL